MYRVTPIHGKWYALEFKSIEDEVENIKNLVEDGDAVVIVDDLYVLQQKFDVDPGEIEIVQAED